MGWIVTGLANLFLELVNDMIAWIVKISLDIDMTIGYDPSTAKNSLFSLTYLTGKNVKGLFDQVFPYAANFIPLFYTVGYSLVFVVTIYKIFETIMSDQGEDPLRIAGGVVMGTGGVACSCSLFIIAERIANTFYKLFQAEMTDMQSTYKLDAKNNVFDMFSLWNNDEFFKEQDKMIMEKDLVAIILMIVFFVALLIQLLRLMAEIFERYVLLGLMFYTCPIAFSMLVSKSTTGIFKKWIQMVVSQFLLMCLDLFFLTVFTASMAIIFINTKKNGYVFVDIQDFITTMLLLIGWLTLGQKIDQHLKGLGLSVAQSGHGLGVALLAGLGAARGAVRMATSTARNGVRGGKWLMNNTEKGAAVKGWAGDRMDALKGHTPQALFDGAETVNGHFTPESASGIFNAKGTHDIQNARNRDGLKTLGIGEDHPMFQTAKGPDGKMHSKLDAADWKRTSMGDNMYTVRDSDGNSLVQLGSADRYEVPDGAAAKQVDSNEGVLTYAATSDVISADSQKVLDSVNASPQYGEQAGVSWQSNGDGTLSGTDDKGNMWQATPDYLATMDPSAGPISSGKVGDVPYSVQKLNNNEDAGFTDVKPAAKNADLVEKSKTDQWGSRAAKESASGHNPNARWQNSGSSAGGNQTSRHSSSSPKQDSAPQTQTSDGRGSSASTQNGGRSSSPRSGGQDSAPRSGGTQNGKSGGTKSRSKTGGARRFKNK